MSNRQSPFNQLPPVIVALFVVIIGIEAVLNLSDRGILGGAMGIGWRMEILSRFGFNAAIPAYIMDTGQIPWAEMPKFVSYLFVHGSFTHAIFTGVMLLAMGNMVARVFSPVATLAIFVVSGVVAATVWGAIIARPALLIGAYPGVYGLIGGYTFILWAQLGMMQQDRMMAFRLIAVLMGLQLIFALLGADGNYTWLGDVIGFVTGFFLSFVVVPGGFARILERMRKR